MASAISASVRCRAFSRISAANSSGVSSTPTDFWSFVPAAGICPPDSDVLPAGGSSRSITSTPAPRSFAASAAQQPHAPAPITATGTETSNRRLPDRMIPVDASIMRTGYSIRRRVRER